MDKRNMLDSELTTPLRKGGSEGVVSSAMEEKGNTLSLPKVILKKIYRDNKSKNPRKLWPVDRTTPPRLNCGILS